MKLFKLANRYIQESDWRTLAALKLCLLSIGLIVGVLLVLKRTVGTVAEAPATEQA